MRVTVRVEGAEELIAALRRKAEEASDALREAALEGAQVIRADAAARAPGPHIEVDVVNVQRDRAEVAIGPDKEHWYYMFFERGTQPHTIRPSTRKKLRFEAGGEEVFARVVRHPGMAAQPFLRPAIDENKDKAARAAGQALRRRLGL